MANSVSSEVANRRLFGVISGLFMFLGFFLAILAITVPVYRIHYHYHSGPEGHKQVVSVVKDFYAFSYQEHRSIGGNESVHLERHSTYTKVDSLLSTNGIIGAILEGGFIVLLFNLVCANMTHGRTHKIINLVFLTILTALAFVAIVTFGSLPYNFRHYDSGNENYCVENNRYVHQCYSLSGKTIGGKFIHYKWAPYAGYWFFILDLFVLIALFPLTLSYFRRLHLEAQDIISATPATAEDSVPSGKSVSPSITSSSSQAAADDTKEIIYTIDS
ncbi:hypothetical protein SAMD00019534_041860 [Acytostelium subglobosum LB1]|uniref:hypothetical protein n=1 Tax=Acytostelium subglobosum LB1 TaxID=1410327 RepID=UPI000644D9ED|nr:hypothetical protein SAMD00019534_041860 [Acytostelium subglobosum LB1]GAM21011.1 hypothetical protein SAMD00019534_041860 [Acytostelium subglobosum LB1]|eukprot:XP_012756145.1 hypothetical protein SAMD00019534_041860 [Acytostelium subglobosum LB1]